MIPLEKEMATHSSTLAWRIPWTEEPDGLQPMGSQRGGHDGATALSLTLRHYHMSMTLKCIITGTLHNLDFPGGSDDKASVYNAGDPDLIPGSGRSPGEGNGNPL